MKDSLGNTPVTWAANFPVQMRQEMAEAAFPCSGARGGGPSMSHVKAQLFLLSAGGGGGLLPPLH